MFEPLLFLIAAAFLIAGFIKGALGLGLPTVSMGLLAVTMPPAQALAIVIVPAIVTNIWQTFVGPYLRDIVRRLWPLLIGTAAGIWLNAGSLTGPYAHLTTIVLGVLLVLNSIIGLCQIQFLGRAPQRKMGRRHRRPRHRHDLGGVRRAGDSVGAVPAGDRHGKGRTDPGARRVLHRRDADARLQPHHAGLLTAATALPGAVAMVCSFIGMFVGQAVRSRLQPELFRRWFLIGMILLGTYLAASALYEIYRA